MPSQNAQLGSLNMGLINVHEHLQSREETPKLLRAMDETGIDRVVLVGSSAFTISGNYRLGFTRYDENNREIMNLALAHPDRIEAWPTINPADPDKLARFRSCHESGATGLKLYLGHGFLTPDSGQYLFGPIAMDHPSMDEVYAYCTTHRLPVCLHINPGPNTPGFADEFISTLERHPHLLVNAPHWILSTVRPSRLAEMLDVFPNLVTDISFGVDEFLIAGLRRISRNPSRLRRVVEEHPDRILFGTDFVVTAARHKTPEWMRLRVETYISMLTSEQYETPLIPSETLNGLNLPGDIMERIESKNYIQFRAPDRQSGSPARSVEWSRLGVPRLSRAPGERLPPQSPSDQDH
jgi:predicted TIM-barrel fold metal-dependent hydrolase